MSPAFRLSDTKFHILSVVFLSALCLELLYESNRNKRVLEKSDKGLKGKVGGAVAVSAHDGGEAVYDQLVRFMLRNSMMVCGSDPLPVFRALNSPQYLDDKGAVKGMNSLAENMISAIMRLNGYM